MAKKVGGGDALQNLLRDGEWSVKIASIFCQVQNRTPKAYLIRKAVAIIQLSFLSGFSILLFLDLFEAETEKNIYPICIIFSERREGEKNLRLSVR